MEAKEEKKELNQNAVSDEKKEYGGYGAIEPKEDKQSGDSNKTN